jgi:hypothetical protein
MKSNAAAKPAFPASVPAPGKSQVPDDDETPVSVSLAKAPFLPTGLSRAIVVSSALFVLTAGVVGLLGDRYSLVPIPSSANAMAYRLDRLTGSVDFCSALQCAPLPTKAEKGN